MDKLWFYTQSGSSEKKGPVPEPDLRALVAAGELKGNDLVWTDGMTNWASVGSLPEFRIQPMAPAGSVELPQGIQGWMSFVAVMNIIGGVFSCLGCISIITGVFMIIAGVALLGAKNALLSVTTIDASLEPFFAKFKQFVQMTGIVYIISIVMMLVFFAIYFSIFAAALAGAMGQN